MGTWVPFDTAERRTREGNRADKKPLEKIKTWPDAVVLFSPFL